MHIYSNKDAMWHNIMSKVTPYDTVNNIHMLNPHLKLQENYACIVTCKPRPIITMEVQT
jgi:hypothetical protein